MIIVAGRQAKGFHPMTPNLPDVRSLLLAIALLPELRMLILYALLHRIQQSQDLRTGNRFPFNLN